MARIYLDNDKIVIEHPFDERLNKKYRQFNFRWNNDLKRREKKLDKATTTDILFVRYLSEKYPKYEWEVDGLLMHLLDKKIKEAKQIEAINEKAQELKQEHIGKFDTSHLKIKPFPYQEAGMAFLDYIGINGFIGDQPGLGKSLSALGVSSKYNLKTLIICPASLKYNWANEVMKFTTKKAIVLSEESTNVDIFDYIIVNYEQLEKYDAVLNKIKFDCLILDESHYIKNLQAKRTKYIMKNFRKIPKKLLLSGTAIKNRPIEFYAQLNFLRKDLFPRKEDFAKRYCNAHINSYGILDVSGASNLDELNRKVSSFYIRREKDQVLQELPPKLITVNELEMTKGERLEYKRLAAKIRKDNGDSLSSGNLMVLNELKMFCANLKIPKTVDFAKTRLEEDPSRKIIIFSGFVNTQKEIYEKLKDEAVCLFGSHTAQERQEAVDKFQNDPTIKYMVASTIAGGIGITLTAADTVIFNDLLWSPADHEQAEDRIYRIGQKRNSWIFYPIFKDSVEEVIMKNLENKQEIINQVLIEKDH